MGRRSNPRPKKPRRLTPELETKIRLHTFYQLIATWLPRGHPMVAQARRVLVEGKIR